MIAALVAAGFDANRGGSMVALPAPADRPELHPAIAAEALSRLVYLPCYADLPDRELARMAEVVNRATACQASVPSPPSFTRAPRSAADMRPKPLSSV